MGGEVRSLIRKFSFRKKALVLKHYVHHFTKTLLVQFKIHHCIIATWAKLFLWDIVDDDLFDLFVMKR